DNFAIDVFALPPPTLPIRRQKQKTLRSRHPGPAGGFLLRFGNAGMAAGSNRAYYTFVVLNILDWRRPWA
ncbi:MAG: hypothetical protein KDJ89_14285, partial [Notoacmeibacter sp.]|nr:hypothetical protein [Notoacmeibacter sp.]